MEKIEKCYKICLDIHSIDLNILFDTISKIGDIIFFEGSPYVWLDYTIEKTSLMKKLKKLQISEFYCQDIEITDVQNTNNFLSIWFLEHYSEYQKSVLETQEQDKLKEMLSNIEKAKMLLQQSTKQAANTVEEQNNKK